MGFCSFPPRARSYWALAVPLYICVALTVLFCANMAASLLRTPSLHSPRVFSGTVLSPSVAAAASVL